MLEVLESTEQIARHYGEIEQWLSEQGDTLYAERIGDVRKLILDGNTAVTVAFCGLFSAGKSSLINALCEAEELRTGAVPTTAEVAAVALPGTDAQVQLLDTPGVDSTDESHREATMNALHRADMVVLVTDYQHVEAEENLELLREFTDDGKRLVFVVNQVDKHLDFELPFADFQARVEAALEDYGIEVEHIFYTSTNNSPHSELDELRQWLCTLGSAMDADERLTQIRNRLSDLVRDAVHHHFAAQLAAAQTRVEVVFDSVPLDAREAQAWLDEAQATEQKLNEELQNAYQVGVEQRKQLREQWMRLIELAQVSPYETTEKGRLYVESLRPDFKVGLLNTAKKTEAERVRRVDAFASDLNERVQNYLIVPLRNQMAQDLRESGIGKDEWAVQLDRIQVTVDGDYVKQLVKAGALVSSQYPYQYVKDVVSRVKRDILAVLGSLIDDWFEQVKQAFFANNERTQHKMEEAHQRTEALIAYLDIQHREQQTLQQLLAGEVPS